MPPVFGAAVADDVVTPGWVKLRAPGHDALSLLCELGDNPPTVTQGYGGWEEVDRPANIALTMWRGHQPLGVELQVFLDDFARDRSIEGAYQVLEAMAGRGEKRLGGEPPALIVNTAGVMPHDRTLSEDARWVVTNLGVDQATVVVNDQGNWTRAAVTVGLLQHVADSGLAMRLGEVRKRVKATTGKRTYVTRKGDTLVSVARKKLGDAGRWPEIAKLNKIRDPRKPLKPNTRLRLP